MLKYIPLLELPLLIIMVLIRSLMLRRQGIKAFVFGVTDKTDYIMLPFILFFVYGMLSLSCGLPFPAALTKPLWAIGIVYICAIALCTLALVWFGITLKIFGTSFRVGIDTNTNDKLITNGTFSLSRNPVYLGFIVFFTGFFLSYPNILSAAFLVLLVLAVHRQILREEQFLTSHYGDAYGEYCRKVRRYLGKKQVTGNK